MSASRLRVGETVLDVEISQRMGGMRVEVTGHGPPVAVDVVLPVPLGARLGGRPTSAEPREGRHDSTVQQTLHVRDGATASAEASWTGGLRVGAQRVELVPGQASHGVRVVDFTGAADGWLLELEGEAGRSYEVRLFGEAPVEARATDAAVDLVPSSGTGADPHLLRVRFPDGSGRRLVVISLPRP